MPTMKTDSPPMCGRGGGGFGVDRASTEASKSRRDLEAAMAIAELCSGGRPPFDVESPAGSRGTPSPSSGDDDADRHPVRFAHIKTAVMPVRHSQVQKALKRKLSERRSAAAIGATPTADDESSALQTVDVASALLNAARPAANEIEDCIENLDPLKRAIEMERGNFMTVKRQRSFPVEEPMKVETMGKFVRCCLPNCPDDVASRFAAASPKLPGGGIELMVAGAPAEYPVKTGSGRGETVAVKEERRYSGEQEVAAPQPAMKMESGDGVYLHQRPYHTSTERASDFYRLPHGTEFAAGLPQHSRKYWAAAEEQSPVSYHHQSSDIDCRSAAVGSERSGSSMALFVDPHRREYISRACEEVEGFYHQSSTRGDFSKEVNHAGTQRIEDTSEMKSGSLSTLSEYYRLGQTVAKSHFFPHLSPQHMPSTKMVRPTSSYIPQASDVSSLRTCVKKETPVLSETQPARTVDTRTARQIRRGSFGSLQTLQDYYRQLSRRRGSVSSHDHVRRLHSQSRSWQENIAPNSVELPREANRWWHEPRVGSDSEFAMDLSVHRNRVEVRPGLVSSDNQARLPASGYLHPDTDDMCREWLRKCRSLGSSPTYYNPKIDLENSGDVEYGYSWSRPSPTCLPSPQTLRAIQEREEDLAMPSPVLPETQPVPDEVTKSLPKNTMPDSKLPLKKRRLHDSSSATEEHCPALPVEAQKFQEDRPSALARFDTAGDDALRATLRPDEDGDLPLHIAVVREEMIVVTNLLKVMSLLNASVDPYNKLKQTPLHLAVLTGNLDIIRMLLDAGASPNIVDRNGLNSVHHAIDSSSVACLQCLLERSRHEPNVNAMTYDGLTALHMAVRLGNATAVSMLIRSGADIDAADGKNGRTALFYAVEHNDVEIAAMLLRNGAEPSRTTYSGCSPVQVASTKPCSAELMQLLESYDDCCALKNFQVERPAVSC